MKITWMSARTTRLAALAAITLATSSAAFAQLLPSPELPYCPKYAAGFPNYPSPCYLAIQNSNFETGTLDGWNSRGAASVVTSFGSQVVALPGAGDGVTQVVPLPAHTTIDGHLLWSYVSHFSARMDGSTPGKVKLTVSLVDPGNVWSLTPLMVQTFDADQDWARIPMSFEGQAFRFKGVAHMVIDIERMDSDASRMFIDNVGVTQQRVR